MVSDQPAPPCCAVYAAHARALTARERCAASTTLRASPTLTPRERRLRKKHCEEANSHARRTTKVKMTSGMKTEAGRSRE